MKITESRKKEQADIPQTRSGWWLVPSFVGGGVVWGIILVDLLG